MGHKRVLIIDDDAVMRRVLGDFLREEGFEPICAADGVTGLHLGETEYFDVVLVDLVMPGLGGLHVIRKLHEKKPDLPLILMSGSGLMDDVIVALREGAWDFLSKQNFDIDQIRLVFHRVMEKSELLQERVRYQDEIVQLNKSLAEEVMRQTLDLTKQNRSLSALNRVAHAVSHSMDMDEILENALAAAVAAVDADVGVIRLLNPATGYLYLSAVSGLPQTYYRTEKPLHVGEDLAGRVVKAGHVHVGRQLPRDSWLRHVDHLSLQSYLYIPLRTGNTTWLYEDEDDESQPIIGALGVVTENERDFSNDEIRLLTSIGTQIGVAVTRAQYASDLRSANEQLAAANADLRRLDVLREQFIQNVAHELRTPLTLVQGYIELLAGGDLLPDQQSEALEITMRRVRSLVEIVEAITTLQDLNSIELEYSDIHPGELLSTVCRMTTQKTRGKNIELVYNPPSNLPVMRGDYTRLAQAIYQLLDNACKFSPEYSKIETGVNLCPDRSGLCFWVKDQGIGIPVEEHERIFELFYQVDGTATRRFGGMGMGLALVQKIAHAHKGSVEVTSTVGEGCTFYLYIPSQ